MATRTVNSPRPSARRGLGVLLAAAIASLAIAAPASALTVTPTFLSAPVAGQTATCLPVIVGPIPGQIVTFSWGNWGSQVFANSNTNSLKLADTAGGQVIFCQVTVKPPLLPAITASALAQVKGVAPANKSLPSISGTAKVGKTVTCKPGNWSALPSSFSFRWLRNGTPTSTGRTRKLTSADRGQSVKCSGVAHNPYGSSAAVLSPSRTVH